MEKNFKKVNWGDYLYLLFFLVHIPITLLIPPQFIFSPQSIPTFARNIVLENIEKTRDPILSFLLDSTIPGWIVSIFTLELVFQLPFFCYACYCLFVGKRFTILGICYCVHVLTTNAIIIGYIVTLDASPKQIVQWCFIYFPFWIIPFLFLIELLTDQ
jgi:hypothetical protein